MSSFPDNFSATKSSSEGTKRLDLVHCVLILQGGSDLGGLCPGVYVRQSVHVPSAYSMQRRSACELHVGQ